MTKLKMTKHRRMIYPSIGSHLSHRSLQPTIAVGRDYVGSGYRWGMDKNGFFSNACNICSDL
ncbi:MAG TPA: hypothetical protein VKP67_10750 [Xanthobacteraceae bacterium]|nr:hypothetical protein [Xanthobacteraceae bacterium]